MISEELEKKLNNTVRSTGFQLGITISLLVIVLLITLNIIVVRQSQEAFVQVVENLAQGPGFERIREVVGKNPDILRFNLDGTERTEPLQEEFISVFQNSLFKVGIATAFLTFISAFLAAMLFTRPLKKLSKAMRELRDQNYEQKLEETGTPEVDEVIQEFNHLATALRDIEKIRSNMIADTSHELKTPLTAIRVQMEGVKDGMIELDEKRIKLVLKEVERLTELIERMQDFAKLQGEVMKVRKKNVVLLDILNEIISKYNTLLEEAQITIETKIPEEAEVSIDPGLFNQLISNLISNTLHYANANTITFSFKNNKLTYKDDGKGVPEGDLPYLFERFYRVDKSRNRATGGLGLGLAIVKEIVIAHGWEIEVESKKGLTFHIFLEPID